MTRDAAPPGMGAMLYEGGVGFRVWAPHAEAVSVVGAFNDWDDAAHPLAAEGEGYWAGRVAGAKAGDRYKFVIVHAGARLTRSDPYARNVAPDEDYAAIVEDRSFDWGADDFQMAPWNALVIYELHVGTFTDGKGDRPGVIDRAIKKLGHLRALGVNAVQLMPPFEFASDSSWGYNPAFIYAFESAYGGPRAFKRFIREAHGMGIAVILDVVYNHLGPDDLDLWRFDGWHEGEGGGIYFYNDWRAETPWGHTRPDYGRPEVRQYLRDSALMWFKEYRVDGLRMDATAYMRNVHGHDGDPDHDLPEGWDLMRWINDEAHALEPPRMMVAEDMRENETITTPTAAGGAGFDAQWCPRFVNAARAAAIAPVDEARSMAALRDAIERRYGGDAFNRVIYTESHDEVANGQARVPYEIDPADAGGWYARKRSTLAAAAVFTAPGIPMIFQGQEFLEDEWFDVENALAWSRLETYPGIFLLYQDLTRLRRNLDGLSGGLLGQHIRVHHVNDADKVIAYHRYDAGGPGDDVVVALNFANRAYDHYRLGFPRAGAWRVRFNSDWDGYGPDYGSHPGYNTVAHAASADGMGYSAEIGIGPYTALIFSQDP